MTWVWPAIRAPVQSANRAAKSRPLVAPNVSHVRNQISASGASCARTASRPRCFACAGSSARVSSASSSTITQPHLPWPQYWSSSIGSGWAASHANASVQLATPTAASIRPSER
jgi:hypothetical protein